jgi:hypothetical protein
VKLEELREKKYFGLLESWVERKAGKFLCVCVCEVSDKEAYIYLASFAELKVEFASNTLYKTEIRGGTVESSNTLNAYTYIHTR